MADEVFRGEAPPLPAAEAEPTLKESKFPTEIIELPSRGYFYSKDNPLSSGEVEIKYMTAREEDILTSKNLIKRGIVFDRLLESVLVNKDININDLLMPDKDAILIVTRMLGYGQNYSVSVSCTNCSDSNTCDIDLSEMDIGKVEEPDTLGKNEFLFKLPISGKNITWKLLTVGDDTKINRELESLQKIQNKDSFTTEITTRLKYLITSIEGDSSMGIIKLFVDNDLLSKDSFELRKEVDRRSPSVDVSYDFNCNSCGYTDKINVPIGLDFFWPSAKL